MQIKAELTLLEDIQNYPYWPDSQYKSMGQNLNCKIHILPQAHRKEFSHKKIFIQTLVWYKSIQTSVSLWNIVLLKGKV